MLAPRWPRRPSIKMALGALGSPWMVGWLYCYDDSILE
ncbi:hypothetical protein D554_1467 [Bordetella holmesii 30539]|uniref:Uncharacterized protein n=2 Tax=Bordetella holmesii TaxID=35814 RepID=A0A158M7F3_9BORD|nr:hypothetical protein D560_2005 [Bordetella holmesii ATCC 51541]AIT26661.1 hypothetical protein D558_1991 [Bordetella holmesii 44057]EWM43136.1 hypothetical protein D556_2003 [Bordetella holmesii 41130]EWM47243.1 hypothetical protein D555_2026 [Bordetella holmesii 35009]EWM51401.1 hypothetical protein D557_1254 [Bordetella holmesii 70147]EXF88656.1 hypothetical protein D554_1467 [Bordetella holmesii 30539]EXX96479.1 hypothetical protein D559_0105 [Bordetella holmesii 1058]KAK82630.1 hypoth